jgi:hypothetical protein
VRIFPVSPDASLQVFVVTNFWEHSDGPREERQGKAIIDAAVAAGAKQASAVNLNVNPARSLAGRCSL